SEAIPLAQRSLAIREKALGPDHPDVATSLNNLAGLYELQGNYTQVLPLYQRSLAIREKALGPDHPDVAHSLNNLAGLYESQGNYAQALPLRQRSTDIEENHLARNLVIGSEEYKRNFLNTFRDSTDGVISFHLQSVPQDVQAARLALTTILRRKGRVLDVLSETTRLLRQRLSPTDQQQFDRIASVRTEIATLSVSPQASTKADQIKQLTAQAEQLEADLSRRSREFAQQTTPITIAAVQPAIPTNAALIEFIEYRPYNPKAPQGQQ
ncbi:MAG: tetratricopeptide repeat-containing protein, partial [Gloeomargarita sp. HHBFW_bins_162]